MRLLSIAVAVCSFCFALPSLASDCQSLGSTSERAGCLWKEVTAADQEMRASYRCALTAVSAFDKQSPRVKFRDRLVANQRLWTQQLKDDCSLSADMAMGSIGATIEPECLADGYNRRDLSLRQIVRQFEDYVAKPTLGCQRRSD